MKIFLKCLSVLRYICPKNYQMPEFSWHLPENIFPNFPYPSYAYVLSSGWRVSLVGFWTADPQPTRCRTQRNNNSTVRCDVVQWRHHTSCPATTTRLRLRQMHQSDLTDHQVYMEHSNYLRALNNMPNTHRRRRRDSTVELSPVGVGGVYEFATS